MRQAWEGSYTRHRVTREECGKRGVLKVLGSLVPPCQHLMQSCVCTKCSIPSHQVCICSSLHWKEFKTFSGRCPLAIKASTWNRNKICNGFRKTCFSQIAKNGNSFSSSLWGWAGLGILWKKGEFEEPAGSSHCSFLMPELISWSLGRAKDSVGSQHVKCLRLSSIKTKSCKQAEMLQQAAQGPCYRDTWEVPIAGACLCTSLAFQEAVTLFPSKSCPQVSAFDLYQLILLALQETIHGFCTSPPPASLCPWTEAPWGSACSADCCFPWKCSGEQSHEKCCIYLCTPLPAWKRRQPTIPVGKELSCEL